jgi:hypothetical protein
MNKDIRAYIPNFGPTLNYEITGLLILLILFDNMTYDPYLEGLASSDNTTCKAIAGAIADTAASPTYCDATCMSVKRPATPESCTSTTVTTGTTAAVVTLADTENCQLEPEVTGVAASTGVTAVTAVTASCTTINSAVATCVLVPSAPEGTESGKGTCEKRCTDSWTVAAAADPTTFAGYKIDDVSFASKVTPAPSDISDKISCSDDGYTADTGGISFSCDSTGKFKDLTGCTADGFSTFTTVALAILAACVLLGGAAWLGRGKLPTIPVAVRQRLPLPQPDVVIPQMRRSIPP